MTESEGVRSVVDVLTKNGVDHEDCKDWEDCEDYEDCEAARPTALPAGVPRVHHRLSQGGIYLDNKNYLNFHETCLPLTLFRNDVSWTRN